MNAKTFAETYEEKKFGNHSYCHYTVKKGSGFPGPNRDVTYQTPHGRE